MENKKTESQWVGITEITQKYLPVSKKKARKIVSLYLEPKMIGNKLFVDRAQLEALLNDPHRDISKARHTVINRMEMIESM